MAQYLTQVAYTSDAWATILNSPQDRISVVSRTVENLGGKLISGWLSFGEFDVVTILEMPDNVGAAAFAMAIAAGGACKAVKTTPLLSTADGVQAMQRAAASGYVPPAK